MKSRIRMFVLVAVAALALPLVAFADDAVKPAAPTHHASSAHSGKSAHKVNLNSASKEQLMKLPGITDEVADKIIAARPFKSTSELVGKSVVTEAEYAKLKGHVTAKSSEPKKG